MSKNKKDIKIFQLKIDIFAAEINYSKLHRHVFVMYVCDTLKNYYLLTFLSFSYYAEEVPMRWDINGFVDNYGRACFDGNCGTVEQPMEHDEGGTLSHSAYSSPGIETPGEKQRVELLKKQAVVGELTEQDQRMEKLKEIDETVPKVRTDTDDTSIANVPTEHEDNDNSIAAVSSAHKDNTQSIEERRANLKLAMMEKVWSFVNKPGDVPIALGYIDRALLQITGIDKGSLLFKVNVSTLDELKRVQELVRYGGMKKILDKELVEKHMEVSMSVIKNVDFDSLMSIRIIGNF